MEQPDTCKQIDQKKPIGEDQELTQQDQSKRHIDGIAAISKSAAGDQFVGMLCINAHAKTSSKRNQTPQNQRQSRQAEEDPDPLDALGMKEFLCAYGR